MPPKYRVAIEKKIPVAVVHGNSDRLVRQPRPARQATGNTGKRNGFAVTRDHRANLFDIHLIGFGERVERQDAELTPVQEAQRRQPSSFVKNGSCDFLRGYH